MSRGPGRIERAIRALFDAHPDAVFVTDELCEHCYPGVSVEKKHRVAVLRAMGNVLKDDPDWHGRRMWGDQGNRWKFYNRDSIASVSGDVRPHRRQRVNYTWEWVGTYPGFGRMRRKVSRDEVAKRVRASLERMNPGYTEREAIKAPTRAARRGLEERERAECEVAWHRLVRDADPERREVLLEAYSQIARNFPAWCAWTSGIWRAWLTKPDIWIKRYQKRAGKAQETHILDAIQMPPPPEAQRLADLARRLITENDPDAIRAGLAEIADALAPPAS